MKLYSAKVRNVKRITNPLRLIPIRYHLCAAAAVTEIAMMVML